jgi:hypothetical protein
VEKRLTAQGVRDLNYYGPKRKTATVDPTLVEGADAPAVETPASSDDVAPTAASLPSHGE